MIRKKAASFRAVNLDVFPQHQHTEPVFQIVPKLYLLLAAKLGSVQITQEGLAWKDGGITESG